VHGDLACRHVLVFRSSSDCSSDMLVKLTDFGLKRTKTSTNDISTSNRALSCDARDYSSATNYSDKADVYSFGVLMLEACSQGVTPSIENARLERSRICSNQLWNIIDHCLHHDEYQRPTFRHIREALWKLKYQHEQTFTNNIVPSVLVRSRRLTYCQRKQVSCYV
jgi:serine/threonine protein kinase